MLPDQPRRDWGERLRRRLARPERARPRTRRSRPCDDAEHRDELPDDLDAAGYVGPYVFPNNNRRRVPGYLYLVLAARLRRWRWAIGDRGDGVLVNEGFLGAGRRPARWSARTTSPSGWDLDVDEHDALVAATREVGFAVGHASAQMGWRGLR